MKTLSMNIKPEGLQNLLVANINPSTAEFGGGEFAVSIPDKDPDMWLQFVAAGYFSRLYVHCDHIVLMGRTSDILAMETVGE